MAQTVKWNLKIILREGCYCLVTYDDYRSHRHWQICNHIIRNFACEFPEGLGHCKAICFFLFHVVHSVGNGTPAAQGNLRGVSHTHTHTHAVPVTLCLEKHKAIGSAQNKMHVYSKRFLLTSCQGYCNN